MNHRFSANLVYSWHMPGSPDSRMGGSKEKTCINKIVSDQYVP